MIEQGLSINKFGEQRKSFTKKDLVELLKVPDPAGISHPFREADRVRKEFMGDEVHIRIKST